MACMPFPAEHELNKQLTWDSTAALALRGSNLPGQPRIALDSPTTLRSYLEEEHLTADLDTLAPRLWLVSTPRYWHISPLHAQAVRGRSIIPTENPQLHLVWYQDRIYIKPIPRYLLSEAFWKYADTQDDSLQRALLGFMRTYACLVRYESDFRVATGEGLRLIPDVDGSGATDGSEKITYERFARFIRNFVEVTDDLVNPRYTYGELRLSRLNTCARLFLGKLTFHHVDPQWSSYLGRWLAPFLSIFAIVSVALSAMQVELGVQGSLQESYAPWSGFAYVSRWFSCLILIIVATVVVLFATLLLFMFAHDIWFARSVLRHRRQHPLEISSGFKSGVI